MNISDKTFRILGVAFLLQFVTSFSSGVFLQSAWLIPDDIGATMLKIANQPWLLRANILLDMLTALGVIFLGAMLYLTLRKQNEAIALTALSFYILEGALLATSKMDAFSLLRISEEFAAAGNPDDLLLLGQIAHQSMDFVGITLHMLAFCLGAILFYFLLFESEIVPKWMSLWGLITIFPMLIGTVTQIFGLTLPFFLYAPYVPFEPVVGVWFLVKGMKKSL